MLNLLSAHYLYPIKVKGDGTLMKIGYICPLTFTINSVVVLGNPPLIFLYLNIMIESNWQTFVSYIN